MPDQSLISRVAHPSWPPDLITPAYRAVPPIRRARHFDLKRPAFDLDDQMTEMSRERAARQAISCLKFESGRSISRRPLQKTLHDNPR